jgi:hypothetical protein
MCDPKKVLRLEKSIYGLKSAGKAFMKQLGDEVLKFVERVEYKSPGDDSVHAEKSRRGHQITPAQDIREI